jgi:hypothetical protein
MLLDRRHAGDVGIGDAQLDDSGACVGCSHLEFPVGGFASTYVFLAAAALGTEALSHQARDDLQNYVCKY